jgi:hypothetical protein
VKRPLPMEVWQLTREQLEHRYLRLLAWRAETFVAGCALGFVAGMVTVVFFAGLLP